MQVTGGVGDRLGVAYRDMGLWSAEVGQEEDSLSAVGEVVRR